MYACPVHRWIAVVALALLASPTIAAENEQWQLATSVPRPGLVRHEGDGYYRIATEHLTLSGEVHFSEDLVEVRFRLYRDGRLQWEKPAPSGVVLIPSQVDLVIMVRKQPGESPLVEGKAVHQGFVVYDVRGRELASIDTGTLGQSHLFPDGRLFYYAGNAIWLRDFADKGRLIWVIDRPVHRVAVHGDDFFSTHTSSSDAHEYTTTLHKVDSGQEIVSLTDSFEVRPQFFAVSADGAYAFVRTRPDATPATYDVKLYRIGEWQRPVITVAELSGMPFAADYQRKTGLIAVAYSVLPPNQGAGQREPRLEIRDSARNLLFQHSFEPTPRHWQGSYVHFDDTGTVRILLGAQEYRFARMNRLPRESRRWAAHTAHPSG